MTLPKGIELLPSGRFRARLTHQGRTVRTIWDKQSQAEGWLKRTRREIAEGTYAPSVVVDPETDKPLPPLFGEYAEKWLSERDLKPSTRAMYRRLLDQHVVPAFHRKRLDAITMTVVKAWYASLNASTPTRRAHAYGLLRTIMGTAVADDIIPSNPCRVRGGGVARRASVTVIPTATQIAALADAMPTPKYRVMTLIAAWCGLRFGELIELRRGDIVLGDTDAVEVVRVRRGAVYVEGRTIIGSPKSEAGVRDVAVPPHIGLEIAEYLATLPPGDDELMFPGTRTGGHIKPASLYKPFYAARKRAALPTLRWHDLRHFAGTTAAQTGATLAEVQQRLGHSTVQAAMRYQGVAQGRDAALAARLSALA